MGQLLPRAWRKPAPTAISTRIDRGYRGLVALRAIKVNSELLSSHDNVAIFSNNVGPGLDVVRIVVVLWILGRDTSHDHEESQAQQKPTMNEAACFHVLNFS